MKRTWIGTGLAWLGWRTAGFLGAGLLVAVGLHVWLAQRVEAEGERAQFIRTEIAKLDKEIAEIANIRAEVELLLARRQVIGLLHQDRQLSGRLLEDLARRRPRGTVYRRVAQEGAQVRIAGYAASYAEVAALMTALEDSPLFARPRLARARPETARAGYPVTFEVEAPLKDRPPTTEAETGLRAATASDPGDPP